MNVHCRNIYFNYPGTDRVLFENLNVQFNTPGLHALFGPSGVGKSSLAQMIIGRVPPDRGQVHIEAAATALYAHNLERLPGWSSIGQHLERVTPAEHLLQKKDLVSTFGLDPLLGQRFDQLSLGQQNRINLVRYLVQNVDILLMDETLSNVDEKMRNRILTCMKEMFPERLFIYISHNVVEVSTFCREIWVLRGPHKHPQSHKVHGQDQGSGIPVDHQALQQTMLEIMNAA
jgi:ABC-type multidrug transport system ATPase subunit